MVIDADGLYALGGYEQAAQLLSQRDAPTIITPHDGEFQRLAMRPPHVDRFSDVLNLARFFSATVVLKGPTTVVASPDGALRVTRAVDARLATAGTGDVLSGVIGALLAQGMIPREAAALGAWWHLEAAASSPIGTGLIASDLLDALPAVRAR
jgi:NAD(P)H-hydrate epimerase